MLSFACCLLLSYLNICPIVSLVCTLIFSYPVRAEIVTYFKLIIFLTGMIPPEETDGIVENLLTVATKSEEHPLTRLTM